MSFPHDVHAGAASRLNISNRGPSAYASIRPAPREQAQLRVLPRRVPHAGEEIPLRHPERRLALIELDPHTKPMPLYLEPQAFMTSNACGRCGPLVHMKRWQSGAAMRFLVIKNPPRHKKPDGGRALVFQNAGCSSYALPSSARGLTIQNYFIA
jgi:hypothetical protein